MSIEKLLNVNSITDLYTIKFTKEELKSIAKIEILDKIVPVKISDLEKDQFLSSDKISIFSRLIINKDCEKVGYLLKEGLIDYLSVEQKTLLVSLVMNKNKKLTDNKGKDKHYELFNIIKNIPQMLDEKSKGPFFDEIINQILDFSEKNKKTQTKDLLLSILENFKDIYPNVISEKTKNKLLWIVYSDKEDFPIVKKILNPALEKELFLMIDKKDILKILSDLIGNRINHSCGKIGQDVFFIFFNEMNEKYHFNEDDFVQILKHLIGVKDDLLVDKIKPMYVELTKKMIKGSLENKDDEILKNKKRI